MKGEPFNILVACCHSDRAGFAQSCCFTVFGGLHWSCVRIAQVNILPLKYRLENLAIW